MNQILNVTDLTSYLYCQRKFYLEKVKGIRKAPSQAMIQGSLRHQVQEIFSKDEPYLFEDFDKKMHSKEITLVYLSMLNEIINEVFFQKNYLIRKFNIPPSQLREKIVVGMNQDILLRAKAVEAGMDKWLGKELWENLEPKYYSEFFIESPNLGLKGKIDRVMLTKNQIIPFELKTRQIEKVYETDEIQLTAYAMLLEEHFNQPISKGILESGNKKFELNILQENRDKVQNLIKEINGLTIPKFPNNFSKCQKCDMKEECDKL